MSIGVTLRMRFVWDKLSWGVTDLVRRLSERGWWPAFHRRVIMPDGRKYTVVGASINERPHGRMPSALAVSENLCHWGEAHLPDMPRANLYDAFAEALWRVSPLPLDQVVVGWREEPLPNGGWLIRWGMCKQSNVNEWLIKLGLPAHSDVCLTREGIVWWVDAKRGSGHNAVQKPFMKLVAALSLMTLILMLIAPAIVPLALKREGVVQSMRTLADLEPKAAPVRMQLDLIRGKAKLLTEIRNELDANVLHAQVIDALSATLPDDTWLDRVDINGIEIKIQGLTSNANYLAGVLGKDPRFLDVRTSTPTVRDPGLNRERFVFEMRWRVGGGT